jgi:hypothetical protein
MKRRTKWIAAGAVVVAVAGAGAGIATAGGGDDSEGPITGAAFDKASAAALESTGGGRVTETEVGDEESYYEVEVTLDDGSQVDVQLDRQFNVVGSSADSETESAADEAGGD